MARNPAYFLAADLFDFSRVPDHIKFAVVSHGQVVMRRRGDGETSALQYRTEGQAQQMIRVVRRTFPDAQVWSRRGR